ncbi:MAG: flagellar filament capping protein FliD [Candidatus Accumulibacter sp.]|jgi:flagellar hook-associated protein 2|nr:flagellar filament capping protein FliD [Accumulibacter sp.]
MGVSSATGLVSGLDTASLIEAYMTYEKQPLTRAQTQLSSTQSKISAMGKVKSAIDALQEAAKKISTIGDLYSYKGSLTNTDVATVTTSSGATAGSYSLEVERLATSHKIASSGNIDTSAGGSITIEIGSTAGGAFAAKDGTSPVTIDVGAGASLSDIAKAINDSDAGVSATVINGQNGPQLMLTSKETGETSQMKITSDIAGLSYDPVSASGGMTQMTAGQDAIVKIDGIQLANTSSNTITDAVTGVTLTLTGTNAGKPTELTVSNDTTAAQDLVKSFVDAYNSARSTIKSLTQYVADGTSGVLNGDSSVTSALSELRGILSSTPSGVSSAFQSLASLGVESTGTGDLTFNEDTFKSAIATDFASAAKSIAAYGTAFSTTATNLNADGGLISNRLSGLNSTTTRLNSQIETLQARIEVAQARYEKQFAALETLLSTMSTNSGYLTTMSTIIGSSS